VKTGAKGDTDMEDLSKEVVQYLSKEIETTSNNAMVFRSRIAFAVFFGPFLILGSFVVAAKGLPISFNLDLWAGLVLVIDCVCFVTLAFICARIEQEAWNQCNNWRKLIAGLHDNPSLKINGGNIWEENKLQVIYIAAYCLLLATFLSAIFITSRVRVVVPPTNVPADSGPISTKPSSPSPQQER
jgi:hypothetical protein